VLASLNGMQQVVGSNPGGASSDGIICTRCSAIAERPRCRVR